MLRLALGTVPLFAVIVGLATALGAYMTYSGVRTTYLHLIQTRLAIEAQQIGLAVERAQSLGIALSAQTTLERELADQAAIDPLLLSLDVHDPTGTVLFSNRAERVGMRLNVYDAEQGVVRHEREIMTDFGTIAGGVLVRYDRDPIDTAIDQVAADVAAVALPAALLAVLAGSAAAFLVLRNLRSRARRAAARLTAPVADSAGTTSILGADAAIGGHTS